MNHQTSKVRFKSVLNIEAVSIQIHLNKLILFIFLLFQMKESIMNQEKLAKLQAQVRIGGKVSETQIS